MKVLTSAQMRALDQKAIEELGIIGPILMENAGLEIVRAILGKFPDISREKVVIVAGKGNNGGDGFVVARHLYNRGCRPEVLLLAHMDEIKGDAALNLTMIDRMGVSIT
ncbi:MAG: bifunctional ADP-dependent NAD(P)H-hydrate dehydratase/NAD(P)H-hydrate epimerase, partial [Candidatus Aminicenantes bacterium]|nr:bifunctional ADP-dependent NAD(P)H-hydrate dehydratase/NAD(P)H-hydrate epimerase [Candidatus Aminicenantes bacterium]